MPARARRAKARPVLASAALAVISALLVAGFSLGNYGKEAMNYFTPAEVAASQWLYQTAPRGAQVVAANSNFPWAFEHYNWYSYTFLDTPMSLGDQVRRAPVTAMTSIMGAGNVPVSYLILTRSQFAEISLTGEWPQGTFAHLARDLLVSGRFHTVYDNADVTILELNQ
jgi:hypothetical protein